MKRESFLVAVVCSLLAIGCRSAERRSAPPSPSTNPGASLVAGAGSSEAARPGAGSSEPASPGAEAPVSPPIPEQVAAPSSDWIEVSGEKLVERIRSSGYRAVIVNAWASWCGPCRREMPMLLALKSNLAPRGIGVMLVSVDEPDSRATAAAFLEEHGAAMPSYVAERPLGRFKASLNPNWPGMLPASFLFDASGKLRYFWGGEAFENELLKVVDDFLAGTLVDGQARFGLAPGKVEPH